MRARDRDAGQFEGAHYGFERGLVGIGGELSPSPANLEESVLRAADRIDPKTSRMIRNFASLPEGSYVWTQTGESEYRLGLITGPWSYDSSPKATAVGIFQVRPAEWLPVPFTLKTTPLPVIDTFARGGRNFQRIRDPEAGPATHRLWIQATTDSA